MKGRRILGIALFALACVFFAGSVSEARVVKVLLKCGDEKLQLSAVRTDGSVVAETKRTKDTGRVRQDGIEVRKGRFILDIPHGEKVMLVISKARGRHRLEPAMIRLKPRRVIAFWADEAKTVKATSFTVTDWTGEDPEIDLGVVKAFKGKLAMSKDPDDNYNALKQVDGDNDGDPDFSDPDYSYEPDPVWNSDTDDWPDIVDPDNDNDNQNDAEDPDDDDDGIPDIDEPDSDEDGVGDDLDPDDDNDGIDDDLDPDDDGDGIED